MRKIKEDGSVVDEISIEGLNYETIVTRQTDFAGKTAGQTWDVPHVANSIQTTVLNENPYTIGFPYSQSDYNNIASNDGTFKSSSTSVNPRYYAHIFKYDILTIARRTPGMEKNISVTDLRGRLRSAMLSWVGYGYGSLTSAQTYGVTMKLWNKTTNTWDAVGSNSSNTSSLIVYTISNFSDYIDDFGYVWAYMHTTYPSDGTIASAIFTDYTKFDMTMISNHANASVTTYVDEQQLSGVTVTAGATTQTWSNLDVSRCNEFAVAISPSATHTYSATAAPTGRDNVELVVSADRDSVISSASQGKKLSTRILVRARKINLYVTNGDVSDRQYYGRLLRYGVKGERLS